jgi:hypothetical protein
MRRISVADGAAFLTGTNYMIDTPQAGKARLDSSALVSSRIGATSVIYPSWAPLKLASNQPAPVAQNQFVQLKH